MPEGPELFLSARFVNASCINRLFTGKVVKSEVSTRNPDIPWDEKSYSISACTRGKEIKLTLTAGDKKKSPQRRIMDILVRFGMSGSLKLLSLDDYKQQKHAHLNFFSVDGMVLSFIDYRRFGKWEINSGWGPNRGPCVIQEPQLFRENVLQNLDVSLFNKPICEAMLDQKYFNGIGNYLRAEILYRAGIPPFTRARDVLEKLEFKSTMKGKTPDLLDLCSELPNELVSMSPADGKYKREEASDPIWDWFRCYYKEGMKNLADHNGRTIWYDGAPGPLVPKERKSRKLVSVNAKQKRKADTKDEPEENEEHSASPKKAKNTRTSIKTKLAKAADKATPVKKADARKNSGKGTTAKRAGSAKTKASRAGSAAAAKKKEQKNNTSKSSKRTEKLTAAEVDKTPGVRRSSRRRT